MWRKDRGSWIYFEFGGGHVSEANHDCFGYKINNSYKEYIVYVGYIYIFWGYLYEGGQG